MFNTDTDYEVAEMIDGRTIGISHYRKGGLVYKNEEIVGRIVRNGTDFYLDASETHHTGKEHHGVPLCPENHPVK